MRTPLLLRSRAPLMAFAALVVGCSFDLDRPEPGAGPDGGDARLPPWADLRVDAATPDTVPDGPEDATLADFSDQAAPDPCEAGVARCNPYEVQQCAYAGPPGTAGVGPCRAATKICAADGCGFGACSGEVLPTPEACDGDDDDCDGAADNGCSCTDGATRPCGTDEGECAPGVQVCSGGTWGPCTGKTGPTAEVCDGKDNDCDAKTDEDLTRSCSTACGTGGETCTLGAWGGCTAPPAKCTTGQTQACPYGGPPGTAGVGLCRAATQPCAADGCSWGTCSGEVRPATEACDGQDNDCDGAVDDNLSVTCKLYTQIYWRGSQGFRRMLPIVDGVAQWTANTPWSPPIPVSSLPGTGVVTAASSVRLASQVRESIWRGNDEYQRNVPVVGGVVQWQQAGAWSGPLPTIATLPGSGDIQGTDAYVVGSWLWEGFWRSDLNYKRSVPLVGGAPDWQDAGAWSAPASTSGLPGAGVLQARSAFVLAAELRQGNWRGNQGFSRGVPINGDTIDFNNAGPWSGPTLLSTLPGSGDMRAQDTVLLPSDPRSIIP